MSNQRTERAEAGGDAIDLPKLWRSVRRRKSWIIVPTALAFAASLAVIALVHPRYTGVAKVLLVNQESYFTRPDKAPQEATTAPDPEAVQSQAEAIMSTALARKAIVKLDLANRPEFSRAAAPGVAESLLSLIGLTRQPPPGRTAEDRLVDTFLSHLNAFPVAKTRVLQIEFVSQDAEFAARGANVVAQLFLDQQEEAKKDAAKAASAWLAAKITELRAKVADADGKVEAFRAQSGLLSTGNSLTAPSQQLADINAQLAAARSAQATSQAKAQMLRSLARNGRLDEDPDVARDDALRRLTEQRATLKAQIAQESRTLLPEHPRMKALSAQLAEIDSQIRLAAEKAARALENEARGAGDRVKALQETLAAQAKTVAAGNQEDVQLRALQLDANAARDQLESYVQKYREAIARDADNAAPADARVIAPATEPRYPTFPKKIPTLLLGALAGFLLSAGIVVSRALIEDGEEAPVVRRPVAAARIEPERIRRPDEQAAGVPPPPLPARASESVDQDDASGSAGQIAGLGELIAHVDRQGRTGEPRFALIAGCGDGASRGMALELGRALAAKGRAVLVDLGPGPQNWLSEISPPEGDRLVGLSEVLAGEASFAAALRRDASSRLDIMQAGDASASVGDALDEALVALAETYDFVVAHAGDWRDEAAQVAAEAIREMIIVAPQTVLPSAIAEARGQIGAACVVIGCGAAGRRSRLERAA
ncbi:MAG TPA: exopolysaccharide transport family protein [Roseiarcus sp.]|nr:exopolysaccharide transport family protein [Roseiarcus sp.]